jgi:hypothetical protein
MAADGRSTLDLVNFENIRDGGVIETPTAYAMLVEVEPREWLTLSEERRSGVYISFLTFLRGLQFPVQFLTMTTEFDGESYIEQFVGPESPSAPSGETTPVADSNGNAPDESSSDTSSPVGEVSATDGGVATETTTDAVASSAILEYGRLAHAEWLDRTLRMANVRDRRFFVVVAVDKGEDDGESSGRFDGVRDALPLSTSAQSVDAEEFYLDEVWARAQRVASQLPRTRVEASILDSREAVLDVLYRVYRGREPPISFNHGTLVRATDEALTGVDDNPLDLEGVFEDADREAEVAAAESDPAVRPAAVGDRPYDGRVQEDYVETVDGSRLLQWYVRNVGPIGRGETGHSPVSVYLGTAAFVVSLVLATVALGMFLGSAQQLPVDATPRLVREFSFGLAAASLPAFLLSLVVLLPSRRMARGLALLGTAVAGVAIALFEAAYPAQWTSTPTGQTAVVVPVYAVGVFALVVAVGFAVRSRRAALEDVDDAPPPDEKTAATDIDARSEAGDG